ncbi:MAG TPA: hypothetical protein PKG98_13345 [Myxococcota bacterium]|nr:hypothetical protein [Myxococcota bacterium]
MNNFPAAAAGHFFRRLSEKAPGRFVRAQDALVPIHQPDRVIGGVECFLPLCLRRAHFLLGPFLFRDVVETGQQALHLPDGDGLHGKQPRQNFPRSFVERQLPVRHKTFFQDVIEDDKTIFLVDPQAQFLRGFSADFRFVIPGEHREPLVDFQDLSVGKAQQNECVG